jgi:hypothetical protein
MTKKQNLPLGNANSRYREKVLICLKHYFAERVILNKAQEDYIVSSRLNGLSAQFCAELLLTELKERE